MDTIIFNDGKLIVLDHPIIPFIEGDGIDQDIWWATKRVLDSAIERAYNGNRTIKWKDLLAGEKSFASTGEWLPNVTINDINKGQNDTYKFEILKKHNPANSKLHT